MILQAETSSVIPMQDSELTAHEMDHAIPITNAGDEGDISETKIGEEEQQAAVHALQYTQSDSDMLITGILEDIDRQG